MVLKFGNCCENWSFHTGAQTRKLALFFLCEYKEVIVHMKKIF